MSILEITGYLGALFIGLTLGVMGGGGSILSVPILAYLFHYDEKTATAYSLFIVGVTALAGGIRQLFQGMVSGSSVIMFGIPAIVGVSVIRRFVIPALPEVLFHINGFGFTRRMLIFGLFAILMLMSAYSTLHKTKYKIPPQRKAKPEFHPLIITEGFFTGVFMGLVGAGGGFLIVPALMIIAKLPIKRAIATSLIIIALNSLTGFFIGDFRHLKVDWEFLSVFMVISIIGILLGSYFSKFIKSEKLKKYFGYFILIMALYILVMELVICPNPGSHR